MQNFWLTLVTNEKKKEKNLPSFFDLELCQFKEESS